VDAAAFPAAFARPVGDYESSAGRARWVRLLLGLTVALHGVSLVALLWERAMLDNLGETTIDELRTVTTIVDDVASIELVAAVVTGVVFLYWLHRCYRNVHELGFGEVRYTPGWAVGYWFVPLLNLWRPKQIIDDLWRSTDAEADGQESGGWRDLPVPWMVTAWWLSFYGGSILLRFVGRGVPKTLADLRLHNLEIVATHATLLVGAALAFWLVGAVTSRQDAFAAGDFDYE
jgi:hypothetical protein